MLHERSAQPDLSPKIRPPAMRAVRAAAKRGLPHGVFVRREYRRFWSGEFHRPEWLAGPRVSVADPWLGSFRVRSNGMHSICEEKDPDMKLKDKRSETSELKLAQSPHPITTRSGVALTKSIGSAAASLAKSLRTGSRPNAKSKSRRTSCVPREEKSTDRDISQSNKPPATARTRASDLADTPPGAGLWSF